MSVSGVIVIVMRGKVVQCVLSFSTHTEVKIGMGRMEERLKITWFCEGGMFSA